MKKLLPLLFFALFQVAALGQGTTLVKDIVPGASGIFPGNFVKAGNKLYFIRRGTGPREFYRTDGTAAGTQLVKTWVKDPDAYDPYEAKNAVDFNGRLVFTRYNDAVVNQHEIWVTDGTTDGTKKIPAPTSTTIYRIEQLTVFNNAVYFVIEGFSTIRGLYRWDGTEAAPVKIIGESTINGGLNYFIVTGGSRIFFTDGWKVYNATNSTAPEVLYDQGVVDKTQTGISGMVYFNGKVLITEGRPIEGSNMRGIRAIDPVTKQYPYIKQELGFGLPFPTSRSPLMASLGGSLYFAKTRHVSPNNFFELWKISPDFKVTLVKQISATTSITPRLFMANAKLLVFSLEYFSGGNELWKSDGTAAGTTTLIERSDNISFTIDQKSTLLTNTQLLFPASDRTETYPNTAHGTELWTSNFTKAGTRIAVDFAQGTHGGINTDLGFGSLDGSSVLLAADRRTTAGSLYGSELWKSDGTPIAENGKVPAAPTLTALTPATGPWGGTVVLTGTNFTGATAVRFNQTTTTQHTVSSATKITVTVPEGATTGKVSVITPGGTATSATNFTIIEAATITAFSPASTTIGSTVTITGTNFTGTTAVKFNNTAATTFTVNSATKITAKVPTGATTGKISVTTPAGTVASTGNILIAPPLAVSSFSPASGPAGTVVVLTGTSFTGATAVKFNTTAAPSFTVNSATQITATVPAGASTGKISVTTSQGTATSAGSFTVTTAQAPAITAFSPASGPVGTLVTLTGSNFTGATAVKFNTTNAPSFTVVSATSLTATVPAGATTGKISVTTAGGTASSAASFTVTATPAGGPYLSAFAPGSGAPGDVVVLTGSSLTGARDVSFGGVPSLGFTVTSPTTISVIVPQAAASGKITVTTPTATHQSVDDFTVIVPTSELASGSLGLSMYNATSYFVPLKNQLLLQPAGGWQHPAVALRWHGSRHHQRQQQHPHAAKRGICPGDGTLRVLFRNRCCGQKPAGSPG
ncbi:IPT/TIG domain-containing protein [Hymenobacter sp. J193]|uniref:IPT/TIG domain-containing protein n=1 Tax=Hymenobacter sp. J193 TaxID=2898429 RepID=UPI002150DF6A|nr:IPT/TIG domain-containing protein [Hymenobacter sp. J193]MCR5889414.1 IPT/TIG domain-containing protein [Hymenobacter sp. J193]